ncbi:MAG: hypothetical protein IPK13_27160 [Deltaproteobacteria bacterium]|nr:hypothetical protein [Deltaproteobacteria bacterium]
MRAEETKRRGIRGRWRFLAANLLIVIVAVLVSAFIIEALFCLSLQSVPLRLQVYLDRRIFPLGATSKRAVIPKDYLLLVGDSYAKGNGDWLLSQANPKRYYSGHVLFERAQRDVISFAVSGADNPNGFAIEPALHFWRINKQWAFGLEAPHVVLAYFYEGNDVDQNALFLRRHALQAKTWTSSVTEAQLRAHLIRDRDRIAAREQVNTPPLWRRVTALDFAARLIWQELQAKKNHYYMFRDQTEAFAHRTDAKYLDDDVNIALVGSRKVPFPYILQGPAIDLTDPEVEESFVVLRASLRVLRETFPTARVSLVYIPSPLSIYTWSSSALMFERYGYTYNRGSGSGSGFAKEGIDVALRATDTVRAQNLDRVGITDPRTVLERHARLTALARSAASELDLAFFDLTPDLRRAASQQVLHGPMDLKHLNQVGQQVVGDRLSHVVAREDAP